MQRGVSAIAELLVSRPITVRHSLRSSRPAGRLTDSSDAI